MANLLLKDVKKVYPHAEKKKKAKKADGIIAESQKEKATV